MLTLQTKPYFSWEGDTDLGETRVSCGYDLDGNFDAKIEFVDEERTDRYQKLCGSDDSKVWKAPTDETEYRLAFSGFLKAMFDKEAGK
jgi:hypothetical protein